jgi:hypothetical protein
MKTPVLFSQLVWRSVNDEMPDDDLDVILHLEDGSVWTGFRDAGVWRFVSGDRITGDVLNWMPFPEPPEP